jgi:hypothetical protein
MTDLIDRADVEHVLRDPRFTVPEAVADAARPMARFRSRASRFANGSTHERRRAHVLDLLGQLDERRLEAEAAVRTRALIAGAAHGDLDVAGIARLVPVACLAGQLGFVEPDAAPRLVAEVVTAYAEGSESDAADAAIERLLAAAPRRAAGATRPVNHGVGADDDAVLRVQLLVQAHTATAALVEGAVHRAATAPATATTAELLAATLRDDPPVRLTRRVDPGGAVVVLRLDGADRDRGSGRPPRTLAFGAGPRACPASGPALAMAGASVEEVRAC